MKLGTKIIIFDLALIMLITGIFIGKAIPEPVKEVKNTKPNIVYENTLKEHFAKIGYDSVDNVDIVDQYPKGHWYCYYIYACGDCYIVTMKNGEIDWCIQLN